MWLGFAAVVIVVVIISIHDGVGVISVTVAVDVVVAPSVFRVVTRLSIFGAVEWRRGRSAQNSCLSLRCQEPVI